MGKVRGIAGLWLILAMMLPTQLTWAAEGVQATSPKVAQEKTKPEMMPEMTQEKAIHAELDRQVAAWNRGDLKSYMQGNWHSPELTFFAGSKESAGWDSAYQRYRMAYLGKDRQMGKLQFTNIRIAMLSPESAFVRGGWELSVKDGSKRSGLFTVVLTKFSEGWLIIHDHSS